MIKLLSANEAALLPRFPRSKSPEVYKRVVGLEPGEALQITADEWKAKKKPWTVIPSLTFASKSNHWGTSPRFKYWKDKKFSIRYLADKSGWLITRVK